MSGDDYKGLEHRLNRVEIKTDELTDLRTIVSKLDTTIEGMNQQFKAQHKTLEKMNENITNLNIQQTKMHIELKQQNERIIKLEQQSEVSKIDLITIIKDVVVRIAIPSGIAFFVSQYFISK